MKLKHLNGTSAGMTLEFTAPTEITVGREQDNRLCLSSGGVSRYHALIRSDGEVWEIRDLGSTNGVKLNGGRIDGNAILGNGDILDIGDSKLEIQEAAPTVAPVFFQPVITAAVPESETPAAKPDSGSSAAPPPEIPPPPPAEKEIPEAPAAVGALLDDFKARSGSLFSRGGKKGKTVSASEAASASSPGAAGKRPRFSGRFFYIIVAALAVVGLSAAHMMLKPKQEGASGASAAAEEPPLVLSFEKRIVDRDNVFRFAVTLDGKQAVFTIDDIRSSRHRRLETEVRGGDVELLRARLRSSGVLKLRRPEGDPRDRQQRRLVVADGTTLSDVTVSGNVVPVEFEQADTAIRDFAEGYGLQTISLTPEELREMAESNFNKAEDLFGNKEARLSNVRDAIARYRVVVNMLDDFVPKPKMWERARKQLAEAETFRRNRLEHLKYEFKRLGQLRDYGRIRQIFLQEMELVDIGSPEYELAKQRLFKLDQFLKKNRR